MIHQHFETIQLERELLQRRPEAFRCVHPALARRPPGCAGSSLEHDDKCSVLMVLICLVVVVVVLVVAVVVLFLVAIPTIPQCLVVVVGKRRRRLVFVCPCLCASAGRPIFFGAASRSFRGFSLWLSVCLCPNSYPACSSRSWLGLQTRAQPRTNSKTGTSGKTIFPHVLTVLPTPPQRNERLGTFYSHGISLGIAHRNGYEPLKRHKVILDENPGLFDENPKL